MPSITGSSPASRNLSASQWREATSTGE